MPPKRRYKDIADYMRPRHNTATVSLIDDDEPAVDQTPKGKIRYYYNYLAIAIVV